MKPVNNRSPFVSIIMPVYNSQRYISLAITSILQQTFRDFEFLIYDDQSTDESASIVKYFAGLDSRIRFTQGTRHGYTYWLNQGLMDASGTIYARMDSDDICDPRRLMAQVKFLYKNPAVVAVGTDNYCIDPDGEILGISYHSCHHNEILAELLAGEAGVITHPSVCIRKASLVIAGGYNCETEPIEDRDLWFRLALHGQLANVNQPLFYYRQHMQSVCHSRMQEQSERLESVINHGRILHGLAALESLPNRTSLGSTNFLLRWASLAYASSNYKTSLKHIRAILYSHPCHVPTLYLLLRVLRRMLISLFLSNLASKP